MSPVRIVRSTNNINRVKQQLQKVSRSEIQVGIFESDDSEIAQLARVHEFGMTIEPKNGKYLAIPSHRKSKGKSPREFNDLFFIPTDNGNGLLAKEVGKDRIEVYFVLVKRVVIPERSFIRGGFDEHIGKIADKIDRLLPDVMNLGMNADDFLNAIGIEFATRIKEYMNDLNSPANAQLTSEVKGSSNPLVDTGRLRDAIKHKVE